MLLQPILEGDIHTRLPAVARRAKRLNDMRDSRIVIRSLVGDLTPTDPDLAVQRFRQDVLRWSKRAQIISG